MRTLMFTVLAASLATGCVSKRKYNNVTDELATTQASLAESEAEARGYVLEIDALEAEMAVLKRKNAELAAFYGDLLEEFGDGMRDGDLELVMFPDRTVLSLSEQIVFPSGSATLGNEGRAAVDQLASFLKDHPNRRFQVQGFTDSQPISNSTFASNWELGAQRAVNVVEALVAKGVPAGQVSAATYGANSPVASNTTAQGRQENRRITVALAPSVDEIPGHQALVMRARRNGIVRYADGTWTDALVDGGDE